MLRYTRDGSEPTEESAAVAPGGVITVNRTQTLKVQAFQFGGQFSAVTTAQYVITGGIAAGTNHTLALKADGTVWTWGLNSSGQLGDGSINLQSSPVQVSTATGSLLLGCWK